MEDRNVAGRYFSNEADYQAALRDQRRIEKIKEKIDMNDPEQVKGCSLDIQNGRYHFETMIGNDFDDEMYELALKLKNDPSKGLPDDNKKKGHISLFSGRGHHLKKGKKGQSSGTKDFGKSTAEYAGLDDCDDDMKAEIIKQLKAQNRRRKIILISCAVICAACFAYWGIYNIYAAKNGYDYGNLAKMRGSAPVGQNITVIGTDETQESMPPLLDDYKNLYLKNKNIIGWLKIADTNIDYPVMQTDDDTYYLTHDFDGNEDKNGCLFMDSKCDPIRPSTNLIIYGHHMKSGRMFGKLVNYKDSKYYEKHPVIQFDTIFEKGTYQIMYAFNSKVYSEQEVTFKYYQFIDAVSEMEFNSNMLEMQKMSLYNTGVTAQYGDRLLTLSTCDRSEKNGRFVVVAKKID